MEKWIEVTIGKQIDRYHIVNISTDDFIDTFLTGSPEQIKDISENAYIDKREYAMQFNVDDRFTVEHYTLKYPSETVKKEWITFVRQHRKYMNKL